jgi:hypothetical protein
LELDALLVVDEALLLEVDELEVGVDVVVFPQPTSARLKATDATATPLIAVVFFIRFSCRCIASVVTSMANTGESHGSVARKIGNRSEDRRRTRRAQGRQP